MKKGNTNVHARIKPIDMLPPMREDDVISQYDRRKDRSKSKSKSPQSRLIKDSSNRKQSNSRLDLKEHADRGDRDNSGNKTMHYTPYRPAPQ